jgi:prepilin peptidase CpaA
VKQARGLGRKVASIPRPFFSEPVFGWIFYGVLVGLTAIAAYVDWRRAVVPKQLTLSILALGIMFNVVRGALLGASEQRLWLFPGDGLLLGGLDGLLFSLIGFLFGFALFFVMWILGTCGGGDVKLMAALGSWLGYWMILLVMLGSTAVLAVLTIGTILAGSLRPGSVKARMRLPTVAKRPGKGRVRRMTYSFPVAVATAALLLWVCRVELHLADPPAHNQVKAVSHERT